MEEIVVAVLHVAKGYYGVAYARSVGLKAFTDRMRRGSRGVPALVVEGAKPSQASSGYMSLPVVAWGEISQTDESGGRRNTSTEAKDGTPWYELSELSEFASTSEAWSQPAEEFVVPKDEDRHFGFQPQRGRKRRICRQGPDGGGCGACAICDPTGG